jgi:hypothetical protein
MAKLILSIIVGIAVAMLIIMAAEMGAGKLYPTPSGVDFENAHALKRLMQQMPVGAYVCLLAGYAIGSFGGGLVATIISGRQSINAPVAVGVVAMVGGILNLIGIPHPLWFVIVSQFMYVPFALLAYLMFRRPEPPLST